MGLLSIQDLEILQMGLENELNQLEEDYVNNKVDENYYHKRKEYLIGHIRNIGVEISAKMFENSQKFNDFDDFLK